MIFGKDVFKFGKKTFITTQHSNATTFLFYHQIPQIINFTDIFMEN